MQRHLLSFSVFILIAMMSSLSSFAQIETEADSLIIPEQNVRIFKDARLDLLEKRPAIVAKLELEEKSKPVEKEIPLYKPIVSTYS